MPASEVWQFGTAILLRAVIAVVAGLLCMKLGQWAGQIPMNKAVLTGEVIAGAIFFISFLVKPVPYPEIDYGDPPASEDEEGPPAAG